MLRPQSPESKKDAIVWSEIKSATFPRNGASKNKPEWTDEMFETILAASERVKELCQGKSSVNDHCRFTAETPRHPNKGAKSRKRVNHDLFERTKGALQAHITVSLSPTLLTFSMVDTVFN